MRIKSLSGIQKWTSGVPASATEWEDYFGATIDHATISDSTIKTVLTANVAIPIYESLIDNNSWSPGDYAVGWRQL